MPAIACGRVALTASADAPDPADDPRLLQSTPPRTRSIIPSTIDPRIFHVKLVLEHLGDLTGKRVADVGCGKGRFARIVKERNPGASVYRARPGRSDAAARARRTSIACAATMTALPLATGSFDGAYATESLEHAVDIPAAVAEMCRIVKPGGRIVIIDKNARGLGTPRTPEWERWFGRKELERCGAATAARSPAGRFPIGKTSSRMACFWPGWQ